ncbi:MAG TPA: hypothetical protein VF666_12400 [Pyrinomonadaceae bacterium]
MWRTKSKKIVGVLILSLAAVAGVASGAHARIPTWLCEHLPAQRTPTETTIFFSNGIISIGS